MTIRIEIGPHPHSEYPDGRVFNIPISALDNHGDWEYHTNEIVRTLDEVDTGGDPVGRFMQQVGQAIVSVAKGGPRVDLLLQGTGHINEADEVVGHDAWTLAVAVYRPE